MVIGGSLEKYYINRYKLEGTVSRIFLNEVDITYPVFLILYIDNNNQVHTINETRANFINIQRDFRNERLLEILGDDCN